MEERVGEWRIKDRLGKRRGGEGDGFGGGKGKGVEAKWIW